MVKALRRQGAPEDYIHVIKKLYKDLEARIITEVEGQYFEIKRRAR